SQISAIANNATPTTSLRRRDRAEPDAANTVLSSDFHDDRQNHRSPAGAFLQKLTQFHADAFFHQSRIAALFHAAAFDRIGDDHGALAEHVGRALVAHKAARHEFRHAFNHAA